MNKRAKTKHGSLTPNRPQKKDLRIAYVLHWNMFREDGVVKKIRTQIDYWKHVAEVRLFALTPSGDMGDVPALEAEIFPFSSFKGRLESTKRLVKRVLQWRPNVIYFRYNPPYPPMPKLFRNIPTLVELNTDDIEEYRLGAPHRYWYNRLTRGQVYKAAVGMVSVSHELARLPSIKTFQKPMLVLANAVDLNAYRQLPAPKNRRPHLVFMGAEQLPWHGEDKIVWLAQQLPEFDIDLIGTNGQHLDLPANVSAHGYLNRTEYERVLNRADVAIGTLALHRKHMSEACPLKVREYLAFGLPAIIAYQDTDFMEGADFLLSIPNTEDNVQTHLEQIRQFVYEKQGYRVPRASISHIDAAHKERQRLEFMSQLTAAAA